jgi:pimeloyl-ACP methyl ester carboxylesterase
MTTAATLVRDDCALAVFDGGSGIPFLFQHGLGGDRAQVAQAFDDRSPWRRITIECRGHGASAIGTSRPFSIAMFADDVLAAADRLGVDRFVAGGISMGAAIALRLAVNAPSRVLGLVIVRPAWTFSKAPANMAPIREIASLIKSRPLAEARAAFAASPTAERLAKEAPDNLASLTGYFDRPDATAFADVLADIAADGGVSRRQAASLLPPTLVIGNREDAVHPLAAARLLADTIPGATFVEVLSKARDKDAHFFAVRSAIANFLSTHISRSGLDK